MKLKTNLFIPEEKFARRFAKELIFKLKTEAALGTERFKINIVSEKPHWTGGKGYGTDTEHLMANKIAKQILRYYNFPYEVKTFDHVTDGIEFAKDGNFRKDVFNSF